MLSGLIASVGGVYLVLADPQSFIDNMSSGKGYIALAVIILGRWSPLGAVAAAAVFGGAEALDFQLQTGSIFGAHIPATLLETLPYVVTIVAVTLVGRHVLRARRGRRSADTPGVAAITHPTRRLSGRTGERPTNPFLLKRYGRLRRPHPK